MLSDFTFTSALPLNKNQVVTHRGGAANAVPSVNKNDISRPKNMIDSERAVFGEGMVKNKPSSTSEITVFVGMRGMLGMTSGEC